MPTVLASATVWTGPDKATTDFSGDYEDPDNWLGDVQPLVTDAITFDLPETYEVRFDEDTQAGITTVADGEVTWLGLQGPGVSQHKIDELELDGGDLTIANMGINNQGLLTVVRDGSDWFTQASDIVIRRIRVGEPGVSGGSARFTDSSLVASGSFRVEGPSGSETSVIFTDGQAEFGGFAQIGTTANDVGVAIVQSSANLSIGGNLNLGSQTGTGTMEVRTGGEVTVQTTIGVSNIGSNNPGDADAGGGLLQIESGADVRYLGFLNVNETGEVRNLGGTLRLDQGTDVDGVFEQAGPTASSRTTFSSASTFGSTASLTQTGGTLQFDAPTTFLIQDLSLDGASLTDTAVWDVNEEVTWDRRLRVGDAVGTFAQIDVGELGIDARDAVLRNTDTGTQADLAIGYRGDGELNVFNGATADVYDDLIIGQESTGQGKVTVAGGVPGTALRSQLVVNRNGTGSNLFVGFAGLGELEVLNGGELTVGNDLVVQVSGAGLASRVTVSSEFFPAGPLGNNPIVDVGGSLLVGTPGASPSDADVVVEVMGRPGSAALFRAGTNSSATNKRVEVRPNGVLTVSEGGNFLGSSSAGIVQNGGRLEVQTDAFASFLSLDIEAGGKLELTSGTLVTESFSAAAGDFTWTGGTLEFASADTAINNLGMGELSPDGVFDALTDARTATIDGDYHQGVDASLLIEGNLNFSGLFSSFDRLVADTVTLDAGTTLHVDFSGNVPTPGQTIEVIQADAVVGTFGDLIVTSQFTFQDLIEVAYTPTSVLLNVLAANPGPGDYNDSGTVEQGDLDLVLNNWGQARPFDPNGDPFATANVDQEELDRVLNNWGSSGVPSFSGANVPEPAGLCVLAMLSLANLRSRRRY